MKRSLRPLCAAFLAAILLAPATASGRRPAPPLKLPEPKPAETELRRRLAPYAECLVGRVDGALAAFLDGSAVGRGAAGRADRLAAAAPACGRPGGRGPAQPLLLRGAIFEALYRREFAAAALPADFTGLPPVRYGGKPGGDPVVATMLVGLFGLFDCAARKDPRPVDEMLRSPIGSEAESQAFAGIERNLAGCQPGVRRSIAFTASVARPYLSEILYTLSRIRAGR